MKERSGGSRRHFFRGRKDRVIVDIAMQYQAGYSESMYTFVNNINTVEGGMHLTGSAMR